MSATREEQAGWVVLLGLSLACSGRIHNLGEEPSVGIPDANVGGSRASLQTETALGGSIASTEAAGTLLGSDGIAGGLAGGLTSAGNGSTIEPVPDSVPSTRFAALYAATICQAAVNCCIAHDFESDEEACRVYYEGQWGDRLLQPSWGTYNSAQAARCIRATRDAAIACTNRELIQVAQDACDGMAGGAVAPGEVCAFTSECDQQSGPAVCMGKCTVGSCDYRCTLMSKAGERCSDTCQRDDGGEISCSSDVMSDASQQSAGFCWLQAGLVCSTDGRCIGAPLVGEPCVGLRCGEGTTCNAGTCVPRSSTGPCPTGSECSSGSYCELTLAHCVPYESNLASGERCKDARECVSGNCSDGVCSASADYRGKGCVGILDCVSGDCPLTLTRCGETRMASHALCSGS